MTPGLNHSGRVYSKIIVHGVGGKIIKLFMIIFTFLKPLKTIILKRSSPPPPPFPLLVLKDLCNANACWLVLIYYTLIITNVAKRLFEYVPYLAHIFYYNFSVNFLQSTWIRPQKIFQTKILQVTSLVNHHPVNIIISIYIAMSDS